MPLAEWQAKGMCLHGPPWSTPILDPGLLSSNCHLFNSMHHFASAVFVCALAGNDPNTTASVLPSDEQIIAWGQELLGL